MYHTPQIVTDLALDGRIDAFNADLSRRAAQVRAKKDGLRNDAIGDHPRVRANARAVEEVMKQRADNFDPAAGLYSARQLEYRFAEVLEEVFPEATGLTFPIDTEVPEGARSFTISRYYHAGRPSVYRAGGAVPKVSLSRGEETFKVHHYVLGDEFSIFEQGSGQFAGLDRAARGMRAINEGLSRFASEISWTGMNAPAILGVQNHPWLAKFISPVPMNSSSTSREILRELNRITNFPSNTTRNALRPNRIRMGHSLRNYLATEPYSDESTDSILRVFVKNSPFINSEDDVEAVEELTGSGPGGADGIFAYANDRRSVSNVLVRGVTPLPIQIKGFGTEQLAYMSHGGMVMRDVASNVLAWVEGPGF